MKPSLKVMFLAAEADPFIKVGGLGDVARSLPRALRAITPQANRAEEMAGPSVFGSGEIDARLVIPFHGAIRGQDYPFRPVATFDIPHANGPIHGEAFYVEVEGLPVYLIAGEVFRPDAPVYTPDPALDGIKFTFFSLAALELANKLNWFPQIIHANDWHTAPAIYAMSLEPRRMQSNYTTATVLGLHNLPYLGAGAEKALSGFGLPPASGSALPDWAEQMPLPLGLLTADHVAAVSPSYAQEILTPEFGSGLHEFLRTRKDSISGILNGIDVDRWDPSTDPALTANYQRDTLEKRRANKQALQRELDLEDNPNTPLIAMITRLDHQKGVDLVPGALQLITNQPWQFVVLGTGSPSLEAEVQALETNHSERIRALIRFDASLSRRIYGGADMLVIPSRYEPCGLTQMIAMRYGCVPVARAVGGLRDTILDNDQTKTGTGFLFTEASAAGLAQALRRALRTYSRPDQWPELQRRGMAQDFSWSHSAEQYLRLYQSVLGKHNRSRQQLPTD